MMNNTRTTGKKRNVIGTIKTIALVIAMLIITGFYVYHTKQINLKNKEILGYAAKYEQSMVKLDVVEEIVQILRSKNNYENLEGTDYLEDRVPTTTDCAQLEIDFRHMVGRKSHYKSLYQKTITERDSVISAYFAANVMIDSFSLQVMGLEDELDECRNKLSEETTFTLNTNNKFYDLGGDSTVIAEMHIQDNRIVVDGYVINGEHLGANIETSGTSKKISLFGKAPVKTTTVLTFSNENVKGKPVYVNPIKMALPLTLPYHKSFSFIGQKKGTVDKSNWLERQPIQLSIGVGYNTSFIKEEYDNQVLFNPNISAIAKVWESFDHRVGWNISISTPIVSFYPFAKK